MEEFELNFPIEYPIRVIGRDEDNFVGFVMGVVSTHAPELSQEDFSTRLSSGDKYISVSFRFIAVSREQVDSLYAELGSDERVKVVL